MRIGHISIYPFQKELEEKSPQGGVASYLKYLLTAFAEIQEEIEIYVFTNIYSRKEEYKEDKITVIRCWKKNPFYIFSIYYNVIKKKLEVVHLQHELGLYGNYINACIFPILLLLFKLSDITMFCNIHGVVDISSVDRKFTIENNSKIPPFVVKIGLKMLISPIIWLSDKIIVHENKFKEDLVNQYWKINPKKIFVIPHGVVDLVKIDRDLARRKIGQLSNKKICMFIGYLTGYKGLELLIDSFSLLNNRNDIFLYIAAGIHPKLKNNSAYLKNVYNFHKFKAERKINKNNYKWVGYIKESELLNYYSASDFTIFPYSVAMSSSGPMAISIGYEVPFIASDVFAHFVKNTESLFRRDTKSLKRKIVEIIENPEKFKKDIHHLKKNLIWKKVAVKYLNLYKSL